ncbi:Serine/threonine-protein kinase plk1 [Mortierella sp. 14UC]|nr:Serine/threonine-protein kinase plk1 [Mortierella sp. 14UC]
MKISDKGEEKVVVKRKANDSANGSRQAVKETDPRTMAIVHRPFFVDQNTGFGIVVAVVDGRGEHHALKVPKPDTHARTIKREIALLKHAGNNKNLVAFQTTTNTEVGTCLLFELLLPETLHTLMAKRIKITEPEVRWFIPKIAEGVKYLNSRGLGHCDLKPANILIAYDMTPKLSDLGNAEYLVPGAKKHYGFTGTPGYAAPEIVLKQQHTIQLDMREIFFGNLAPVLSDNKLTLPAKGLLRGLLNFNPMRRLKVGAAIAHEFFSSGYCPTTLDRKAFDEEPSFEVLGKHSHDDDRDDNNSSQSCKTDERPSFKKRRYQPRPAEAGIEVNDELIQDSKGKSDATANENRSVKEDSPAKVDTPGKDRGDDKVASKDTVAAAAVESVSADVQDASQMVLLEEAAPAEVVVHQEKSQAPNESIRTQIRDVCAEYVYITALACSPSPQAGNPAH